VQEIAGDYPLTMPLVTSLLAILEQVDR